jgi:hypothetical protein
VTDPPKRSGARRWLLFAAIGILPLTMAVWGFSSVLAPSVVTGRFVNRGGKYGDWTLTPTECTSGQRAEFFGVILQSETPPLEARIIEDATRRVSLDIDVPGTNQALTIDCPGLRANLVRTHSSLNGIWEMEGDAHVDCDGVLGGHLTGDLTFARCH